MRPTVTGKNIAYTVNTNKQLLIVDMCGGDETTPETTFKFLSRCPLYVTCNHVLVINFGNIKTEEKWHDLNLTINETE